jgi:hypothetical protein
MPHREALLLSVDDIHRAPIRSGILILCQFLFVLMMASAIGVYFWQQSQLRRADAGMTVELEGAPPAVEPVVLKQVAPEVAEKLNAALPFSTRAIIPASPFRLNGSAADISRATDCLASALYYEAANESIAGQMAVAQVVLNRVRHPAFPKSVCGVVYQGQERRTGCQFSFSCDGSMARHPSPETWERLRALSVAMLGGQVYAPVGLATHYHANYVIPYWSATLDKLHQEGVHIFYTWPGAWGSRAAFRNSYAGAEPGVAKLAALSPAHSGAAAGLAGLDLPTDTDSASGTVPPANALAAGADGQFILTIDRGVDPSLLPNLAAQVCGNRDYCKLIAWTSKAAAPKAFPIDDAQLAAAGFSYLRNKAEGYDKTLWNCALFLRTDRKQCMKRRVVLDGKVEELIPAEADTPTEKPVAAPEAKATTLQPIGRRRPGAD